MLHSIHPCLRKTITSNVYDSPLKHRPAIEGINDKSLIFFAKPEYFTHKLIRHHRPNLHHSAEHRQSERSSRRRRQALRV